MGHFSTVVIPGVVGVSDLVTGGETEILMRVGEDGVALEGRGISTVLYWFTFWALNCSWKFLILQSFISGVISFT